MARQLRVLASCLIAFVLVAASVASAQEREPNVFAHAIKTTLIDPTTYMPAALVYDGTMRDWNTSQPFFRNGYVEQNPRFTRSGRSNDFAISYEAGRTQIVKDSFTVLGVSAVHNVATRLIERGLREQHPDHPKLITALGWIERSAVGSMMAYGLATPHYRQWRDNQVLAGQLGLR